MGRKEGEVAPSHCESLLGGVGGIDAGSRERVGKRQRDRAGASADVADRGEAGGNAIWRQSVRRDVLLGVLPEGGEHEVDESLGFRARNEHGWRYVERERNGVKRCAPKDVLQRLPIDPSP